MIPDDVLSRPIHIGPRRIAHANLFVSDLEASVRFYRDVCGLELVMREPPIKAAFFSNGNTHHDLGMLEVTSGTVIGEKGHQILPGGVASRAGLYHLGWEMESEFELVKAHRRAIAAGFRVNRTTRHRSSNSVYVSDPDGNIHEFYADFEKDWRSVPRPPMSATWDPEAAPAILEPRYEDAPDWRAVAGAPIHPRRFSHAVLEVEDFERMCAFFGNFAGLYECVRLPEAGVALYTAPACNYAFAVALVRAASGLARRRLHHIAFEVATQDALCEGRDRLAKTGVKLLREVDLEHKSSIFIADPDGVQVEFCHRRKALSDVAGFATAADAAFLL